MQIRKREAYYLVESMVLGAIINFHVRGRRCKGELLEHTNESMGINRATAQPRKANRWCEQHANQRLSWSRTS